MSEPTTEEVLQELREDTEKLAEPDTSKGDDYSST
jgi:hypothetical protein